MPHNSSLSLEDRPIRSGKARPHRRTLGIDFTDSHFHYIINTYIRMWRKVPSEELGDWFSTILLILGVPGFLHVKRLCIRTLHMMGDYGCKLHTCTCIWANRAHYGVYAEHISCNFIFVILLQTNFQCNMIPTRA